MTEKINTETLLLTGGSRAFREAESKKIASKYSSKFDTQVIDTDQDNGINNVREIIKTTSRKPYDSQLISIIILEAHKLTSEAQNALLKLLEEPGSNCQIILTAPTKDSLLPTVGSRLQEIALPQTNQGQNENFSDTNLSHLSLSERLAFIEKSSREEYLQYWANKLKGKTLEKDSLLKPTHRYSRLLLKMLKAEKSAVNKKLIDLILALEVPIENNS